MPTPPSGARFKITNGATVSPSTDRGCDAEAGDTLIFQLEASPALDVRSCTYQIRLPTKGAPSIALSSSGVASPPTAGITSTMPSGVYSFVVLCQTNGGAPVKVNGRDDYTVNTFERIVSVRSVAGLRKPIIGETLEYDPIFGWMAMLAETVDAIDTLGGVAGGAVPTSRTINGSADIAINGGSSADLSANVTVTLVATSAAAANFVPRLDGSGRLPVKGITVPATATYTDSQAQNTTGAGVARTWSGQDAMSSDASNGGSLVYITGKAGDTSNNRSGDAAFCLGPEDGTDGLSGGLALYATYTVTGSPFFRINSDGGQAKLDGSTGGMVLHAEAGGEVRTQVSSGTQMSVDTGIALHGAPSYGGGSAVTFIHNCSVAPGSNPSAGGILYVEAGALKYRGSSGTVTTIAPA